MSEYFPEVAWRTVVDNVTVTATPYYYTVDVFPLDSNEPGADPLDIAVGYWLIDNGGYTYLITDVSGSTITVYDINERSWGDSYIGPLEDLPGYVYKTKNGAFLLSQSQLRFLDKSAPDMLYPIEKGIIWKYRGIEINALYGDGEVVETIAEDSIDNITKLSLSPEFILRTEEDGWQGGKKYSLSLDGLLHNTFPDVQGTGLDDDYIHLDQDQIDALWAKDGLNITRDSAASLTGILNVNEIKSYTSDLPLIKKDGNNVRISTCILSDCVNDRVGIFTETPLDHLHLTGYARISTLAETANSSLVTSNADGRLIKLPYDNNESKYLRSDGTWAAIITSTGDFLDSVTRMVVDSTFNPGTPSNGDRYIILNTASIHANFGAINKFSDGSALTLGNNDIVQYYSTYSEFRIVYDASAAMQPATVTVGTDKNGNTNHQWTYNVTDDMWVDRGAAINHNSLDGLNDGNYKHLIAAQYTNFISLTDGSDISNTLHNHNTQYAIKQSSTTDTTSGRGLIVGAFGLGSNSLGVSITDDTRTYNRFGLVRFWNSGTNKPFTYGTILSIPSYDSYYTQIITSATVTNSIGFRKNINGTYSDYFTFHHTGNLVNPVTGTGSAGQISYWNGSGSQTGSSNLVWDNTNGRLGIGGTPLNPLHLITSTHSNSIQLERTGTNAGTWKIGFWGTDLAFSPTTGSFTSADTLILSHNKVGINKISEGNALDVNGTGSFSAGVAIGKTSVTSGYMLDVNGAIQSTGLKIGTLSGLLKASSGVVGTATAGTDYTAPNVAITGATKTKITYDSKGLVTSGADATTTDIAEGTRLYYTNARARAAISLTTIGTSGVASYTTTTGVLNIPQYQAALTNPVTGTGTAGYLPKFTGTSALGNSVIYETGVNILIGTTSSRSARLQVVGSVITTETPTLGSGNYYTALFNWSSNIFGLGIHNNTSGRAYIQNQRYDGNTATYDICLQPLGGAVAIGKTSVTSGYMLDINGNTRVGGNILATENLTINGSTVLTNLTASRFVKTNATNQLIGTTIQPSDIPWLENYTYASNLKDSVFNSSPPAADQPEFGVLHVPVIEVDQNTINYVNLSDFYNPIRKDLAFNIKPNSSEKGYESKIIIRNTTDTDRPFWIIYNQEVLNMQTIGDPLYGHKYIVFDSQYIVPENIWYPNRISTVPAGKEVVVKITKYGNPENPKDLFLEHITLYDYLDGYSFLEISPTALTFSSSGGSTNAKTVTVSSNISSISIVRTPTWITLSKSSGSGNFTFSVQVLNNASEDVRFGTITISGGGFTRHIVVAQAGVNTPTDPSGGGDEGGTDPLMVCLRNCPPQGGEGAIGGVDPACFQRCIAGMEV